MASDVSYEALDNLVDDLLYGFRAGRLSHGELLTFAKRIRDLTAARCVEVASSAAQQWDSGYEEPAQHVVNAILAAFPGAAAAEGEARDG